MRHGIITLMLMFTIVSMAVADCGNMAPPQGVLIGVCENAQRERTPNGWVTIYNTVVMQDSAVGEDAEPLERGTRIKLYTPGGPYGPENITTPDGPLSSVSVVRGEKFAAIYTSWNGKYYLVDKWSVWRVNVPVDFSTPRAVEAMAARDAELEMFLSTTNNSPVFADSLELYHTRFIPVAFADPNMDENPGLTWMEAYGFLGPHSKAGIIRQVITTSWLK